LVNLTTLNLSSNKLAFLDEDVFEKMPSLCTLSLNHNRLTRLPSSITALRSLSSFSCNNNQLDSLPPDFVSVLCHTLTTLRLAGNLLTQLPDDFAVQMLPRLNYLDLTNNPIIWLPFTDDPESYPTRTEIYVSVPQRVVDNLFIGDATVGENRASLLHHNISHVLMLLQYEKAPFPEVQPNLVLLFVVGRWLIPLSQSFIYKVVAINDDDKENLLGVLEDCCAFIEDGMGAGGVLVHWCAISCQHNSGDKSVHHSYFLFDTSVRQVSLVALL